MFSWYIKYPNQNDEILNLDWILSTIENLVKEVSDFVTLNTIKYADPIQWNITKQYEKNTVVVEPISGTAYISNKPVPAGVGINNTDYWNIIFTLDVISANKNITLRDDANNMLATFESNIGDWLLWQGTLYTVTRNIEIGQAYVADYNISRYTVELFVKDYIQNTIDYIDDAIEALSSKVGDLDDLETTAKNNLVAALNEVRGAVIDNRNHIGELTNLDTTAKNNLVAAINEVRGTAVDNRNHIGELSNLDTLAKNNLVAAINEVRDGVIANRDNVTNLVTRGILLIGDSYMQGNYATTDTIENVIEDMCHAECFNYSYGGTGFVLNTDGKKFENQIINAYNDSNLNKDRITDILVAGGYNDSLSLTQTDYSNSISSLVNTAKTRFPNARLHIAPLLWTNGAFPNVSWEEKYIYLMNACLENNVDTFKYAPDILFRTSGTIYSDGVHPNSAGYKLIGRSLSLWLNGKDGSPFYKGVGGISINGATGNLSYVIQNGRADIIVTFSPANNTTYDENICNSLPDECYPANNVPGVYCMRDSTPTLKNFMLTSTGIVTPSGMNRDNGGLIRLQFNFNFHPYIYE